MIRLPQDGILYHGSYSEVSHIDLSQCRSGLDFGKGFYVTSSLKGLLHNLNNKKELSTTEEVEESSVLL